MRTEQMELQQQPRQGRAQQYISLITALDAPSGYPQDSVGAYALALAEAISLNSPEYSLASMLALADQVETVCAMAAQGGARLDIKSLQAACAGDKQVARLVAGLSGAWASDDGWITGLGATETVTFEALHIDRAIAEVS